MDKTIHTRHADLLRAKLLEIRKGAGLTQRQLADKLNRSHTLVSKYELGERRTDLVEFYWICKACGVSPEKAASQLLRSFDKL